jgi:hypothetical protein
MLKSVDLYWALLRNYFQCVCNNRLATVLFTKPERPWNEQLNWWMIPRNGVLGLYMAILTGNGFGVLQLFFCICSHLLFSVWSDLRVILPKTRVLLKSFLVLIILWSRVYTGPDLPDTEFLGVLVFSGFSILVVWTWVLALARRVLCLLSHATSPFCFVFLCVCLCFEIRVSLCTWARLDLNSPNLHLLSS